MSQRVLMILMILVGLILMSLLTTMYFLRPVAGPPAATGSADAVPSDPLQSDQLLVGYEIPEFALTDQEGRPVDQSILDGELTVLTFMFTNCPFACPGMTAEMLKLQSDMEGTGLRFLSVTVDPANDSPEVLKAYGERNGMDFERWSLLTGPFEDVRSIVRDSLNFFVGEDTTRQIELADGSTMNNVSHPSHLILIGPDRQVLGIYLYYEADRMIDIRTRVRAAAQAMRAG
ncbi:MAG: SCO family protein [Planctomycetota bacterium]